MNCPQCGLAPAEHNNQACNMRFDSEWQRWHPEAFGYASGEDMDAMHDALDQVIEPNGVTCCICDPTRQLSSMDICRKHEELVTLLVEEQGLTISEALLEALLVERGG